MLYASDLQRFGEKFAILFEHDPIELRDLLASLLIDAVDKRRHRHLSRGYRRRDVIASRVRGRIDIFKTDSRRLLDLGKVACRFEEQTIDIPRNRLVRAALYLLSRQLSRKDLRERCGRLAQDFGTLGVSGVRPSSGELTSDQVGRNDAADLSMIALARFVFDMSLPTEEAGSTTTLSPDREEVWVRRLFETALAGFYRFELERQGWKVHHGRKLNWQISSATDRILDILPSMKTDILLRSPQSDRLIVIDTKFTSIITRGYHREHTLKSNHIYQVYSYLRSQVDVGHEKWSLAEGILLYPAIDARVDESVRIDGHKFRFVTVDLSATADDIRAELRGVIHNS